MPEEIQNVTILSGAIITCYLHLTELIIANETDSEEFKDLIKEITRIIEQERKEYQKIDLEQVNKFITIFDQINNTPIENRVCERLKERKDVILNIPRLNDYTTLGAITSAKIMLDTIKLMEAKIKSLEDDEEENEQEVKLLYVYHKAAMFEYLTNTTYIEKRALKYNFDVEKIPAISYTEINELFNVNLPQDMQKTLLNHILEDLLYLDNINELEPDKILNTYLALFELSRIEAMIKDLEKNTLELLRTIFNAKYGTSKKEQIRTAKKIIKQRKK